MSFSFDVPIQEVSSSIASSVSPINVGICHPKYERAREILAILNDPRFANLDEMILSIEKNDQGYRIITDSYEMQVDVRTVQPSSNHPMCGHRQFELVFHDPLKLSNSFLQAIHPKYQTAREICAILHDPTLFEKLGNDVVQEIRKTEDGYMIVTSSSEIKVDVNYHATSNIGDPDCFDFVFHDSVPLNQ